MVIAMAGQVVKLFCAALALVLSASAHGGEPGEAAPDCKLTSIDGKAVEHLQQYRGKVLYVDFWASWCGPCAQSFPFMERLDRELRARGLEILGVNLDEDPGDAREFLAEHPVNFRLVADVNGQCARSFGVRAMPSSYLVDRQGVIREVHLGFRPGEAAYLRSRVEQLLAESPYEPTGSAPGASKESRD
jgi:peroxiredoxin